MLKTEGKLNHGLYPFVITSSNIMKAIILGLVAEEHDIDVNHFPYKNTNPVGKSKKLK